MMFSWQNKCTESVGEDDLSTKRHEAYTQPQLPPGYHETLKSQRTPYRIYYIDPRGESQEQIFKYNDTSRLFGSFLTKTLPAIPCAEVIVR
jgi:hypothetical protein